MIIRTAMYVTRMYRGMRGAPHHLQAMRSAYANGGWFFLKRKKHLYYSVLKLFTGFAIAALIAWKLTVINAIKITNNPAAANNHQLIANAIWIILQPFICGNIAAGYCNNQCNNNQL